MKQTSPHPLGGDYNVQLTVHFIIQDIRLSLPRKTSNITALRGDGRKRGLKHSEEFKLDTRKNLPKGV